MKNVAVPPGRQGSNCHPQLSKVWKKPQLFAQRQENIWATLFLWVVTKKLELHLQYKVFNFKKTIKVCGEDLFLKTNTFSGGKKAIVYKASISNNGSKKILGKLLKFLQLHRTNM